MEFEVMYHYPTYRRGFHHLSHIERQKLLVEQGHLALRVVYNQSSKSWGVR